MARRTIWLVGMMGAGKSAVGRALARRLGRPFYDADAEVEARSGLRVAELFAREGEAGFRRREREAIEALAGRPAVVALGGGAVSQPGARERLAASGRLVWLRARPETLLERVGEAAERPLLAGLGAEARLARLRELLAAREPHYAAADLALETDGREVEALAEELAARLSPERERAAGPGRRQRGDRGAAGDGEEGRAAIRERSVPVALGERSYDVRIGWGTLPGLGAAVAELRPSRALLVSVPPVDRRYGAAALRSLRGAGLRTARSVVPDGDRTKNLGQVAKLYEAFLDAGADRSSVVVALGGGMVGDLAGFAAATLLRGMRFVQVPTTLLAMIDSSVGGKTGVNLRRGKNLVGAFHQPRLVWVDASLLRSLPRRVLAAGMAEVIKHGAIRDAALFERLEGDLERVMSLEDPELVLEVLERAVAVKTVVVAEDEREAGVRVLLNFGHTLGHAVEALRGYRGVLHGEAVAMGMVFAARRSEALGIAPEGTADRLAALLRRAGLPTELPAFPRRAYLAALRVDKKRQDARLRFVVLKGIGEADTRPLLPEEILPAEGGRRRAPRR
jgi:3-dehydroquinate synthase